MNLSIFNSLCYTAGWFWCVLLGIDGQSILAALGAIILIVLQLYCVKRQDVSLYIQDLLLMLFSIPLGIILETFFIQIGAIRYVNTDNIFPPIWIICLYPLFSLLINHSLNIMKKYPITLFMLGLLAAPLSYIAGRSLGGLSFHYSLLPTYLIIGVFWGVFLSFLAYLARMIKQRMMSL